MYFNALQIVSSIKALENVPSFHGITFLTCKQGNLHVGKSAIFAMDAETHRFMQEHHRIDPRSNWFFQPFKSSGNTKTWVRPDYPAKGLQSVNTGSYKEAFLHDSNTRIWGWVPNYVEFLQKKLVKQNKIPTFDLAVWLYRDINWPNETGSREVIERFLEDYKINDQEKNALFDVNLPVIVEFSSLFQLVPPTWREVLNELKSQLKIEQAEDVEPDQGEALAYLKTYRLGPAQEFEFEPAQRLNIITGDNGLGKTFLLETAWWALTGTWAEQPMHPSRERRVSHDKEPVQITFEIGGEQSPLPRKTIAYEWKSLSWPQQEKRPVISGLIVYARVDGSYAIWDPVGQKTPGQDKNEMVALSRPEVWGNIPSKRIEGLIRDWVRWQSNPQRYPYETFIKVLERLSPPEFSVFKPGEPTRIPGGDKLDIPTIVHPYGEVPIMYASAGVRRVVTLAYLIVWAWHEHVLAAEMSGIPPQRRMIVLIDELEAHLHPFWQREILPALMDIAEILEEMLKQATKVQYIVSTHSPMVMASSETVFDEETDKLFHMDMQPSGEVILKPMEFYRYGDASAWFTSPFFNLLHARSKDAENAIEAAKALQLKKDISSDQVKKVNDKLLKYLAPDDYFWPRWIVFAERHGAEL